MTKEQNVVLPSRSLVLVGVFIAVGAVALAAIIAAARWRNDETYRAPIGPSTIVLLGDSLTEGGDWGNLLPDHEISNRGYAGYTTAQLRSVAEEVASARPRAVFILTGTNDIRDGHPPSWTLAELTPILDTFDQRSPETIVILQTLLPRADAPAEIAAANAALKDLAERRGLRLVDLHPDFDDGQGGLRAEETTDDLHLAEPGYQRWARVLDEFLDSGL